MKFKARLIPALAIVVLACGMLVGIPRASALTPSRLVDDVIFNNFNSMGAAQIDAWLNGFSGSCLSPAHGFTASVPSGYSPSTGFTYGAPASAGTVIYDAAQAYGINPQVLLTKLQNEEGLVKGDGPYGCSALAMSAAVGYQCTDSDTASHTYNYTNGTDPGTLPTPLFYLNGSPINSVSNTCVHSNLSAGFTEQVIRAAWFLRFGEQRSEGNVNWAVEKPGWDNSDDPQSCYGGPMTQGTLVRCPSGAAAYYDGYTTIDGQSIHMDNGATAALYWYTPHIQSFSTIFNGFFGSPVLPNLPGCTWATNTTRACIWQLMSPGGEEVLTSSVQVRDELYEVNGYQFVGINHFANSVPLSGNIPVYRATDPGGGSFLTTNQTEYNAVVSGGYTGNGVDFYADPSWSNTGYPVYRVYNSTTGQHFWTSSLQQEQSMVQAGWTDEGIAYTSISTARQEIAPPQGKYLVYRFYIPQTYEHFWTTDISERDRMINAGYQYEGVAWDSSANTSDTPVYRLYAPAINQHLYTTDSNERDTLVAQHGWIYEGVSQYVSTTANSQPVYRLYAPSMGLHMITADANERNQLISSGRWNNEGTAWYQP